MSTTAEETNILANESQFQKIHHTIATTAKKTSGMVVVSLDIDGVQEGARAALEEKLFKHFRDNPLFERWFIGNCFPKFIEILDKFTLDGVYFPLTKLSFEEKIATLLSYPKEDLKKALQDIIDYPDVPYRLVLLNLQQKLYERKEGETSEELKKYLKTKVAFVCAMHLSAALCVGDALILGEPGEQALKALSLLYQEYQHKEKNRFVLFNLTSRTPAMAHVFKLQLEMTFGETAIHDLENQGLRYTHDEKILPNYTTSATGNVIAASRHKKHKVAYGFLLQNDLLSDVQIHPLTIIFVDDKPEYLKDMQELPGYYAKQTGITQADHIQVIPIHFFYNKNTNTILSYVNKKFNDTLPADLNTKTQAYLQIAEEISDTDAKEVVLHYLQPFLLDYLVSQASSMPLNSFGAEQSTPPISNASNSFVSQLSGGSPLQKQKLNAEESQATTINFSATRPSF